MYLCVSTLFHTKSITKSFGINSFQNISSCQFIVNKLNKFDFSFSFIWNSLLETLIHNINCSTAYLLLYISVYPHICIQYVFYQYIIRVYYMLIIDICHMHYYFFVYRGVSEYFFTFGKLINKSIK